MEISGNGESGYESTLVLFHQLLFPFSDISQNCLFSWHNAAELLLYKSLQVASCIRLTPPVRFSKVIRSVEFHQPKKLCLDWPPVTNWQPSATSADDYVAAAHIRAADSSWPLCTRLKSSINERLDTIRSPFRPRL